MPRHPSRRQELALICGDLAWLYLFGPAGLRDDKKALARMKRSAYLINTARGPVIDEEALAWALQHHLLAGAALDVYEHEPAIHPDLMNLDNVLLAPHIASATTETRTAMADLAADHPGPMTARGEITRRKILDAAEEVFGKAGYYDASIAEITRSAGARTPAWA